MPITVQGTPEEIFRKLTAAKAVTTFRNQAGWPMFQFDEEYTYIPVHDDRLCPVCAAFAGMWNGAQIPVEFPDWRRPFHPFRVLINNEVYPNVHTTYPFLKGDCRCVLNWDDYLYVLTNRLMTELEAVIS